jgi:hypothetical protein
METKTRTSGTLEEVGGGQEIVNCVLEKKKAGRDR